MRRGRIVATVVAAALATPAAAAAQVQSVLVFGVGQPVTQQTIPVRTSGHVLVQFHGDAAAGCASHGLCGYRGTVVWTPAPSGQVIVGSGRAGGHIQYTVSVFPQPAGPGAPVGGITSANVTQAGLSGQPITCTDAVSALGALELQVRHGQVRFRLAQNANPLLTTRCAGPRDDVILPLLPAPQLSLARIRRGRLTVGLGVTRSFAGDGFAGTIVSDLALHLERAGETTRVRTGLTGGRPHHQRQLHLSATLAGSVMEQINADPNPDICGPLGACGATGTLTIQPQRSAGTAQIELTAPVGRPAPALSSLGSTLGRRTSVLGSAFWDTGSTVDATIVQGSERCTDSGPLGGSIVTLGAIRGRLTASYASAGFPAGTASFTGCPGPAGVSVTTPLAAGSVSLSRLARRRITIRMTMGTGFQDYGYGIRTTPHLTLTLIRRSVRTATVSLP